MNKGFYCSLLYADELFATVMNSNHKCKTDAPILNI